MAIVYIVLGLAAMTACLLFAGATRVAIRRRHRSWVSTAWASVISVVAVRGLMQLWH
jgi:steroid 5-alpha reductase family enzyme